MGAAVEKAYRAIRAGIADGTYPSNAHITAGELALKLGVSRTPVREALRRLHAEGLINFVANHGAYVTSWTRTDIDEVFELRSTLESYAAERAARRLSPEQLAELNQLARRMELASPDRGGRGEPAARCHGGGRGRDAAGGADLLGLQRKGSAAQHGASPGALGRIRRARRTMGGVRDVQPYPGCA
jgi:DNA-binding FadR family transcriptional regulator